MRIFKTQQQYAHMQIQYKCVLDDIIIYISSNHMIVSKCGGFFLYLAHVNNTYDELSPDDPEYKLISMMLL